MMRPTADEIYTQQHLRYFYQKNGPDPTNTLKYAGQDGTYLVIESVTNPKRGGISPQNVPHPRRVGHYKRAGRKHEAPDFPQFTVKFMQLKDALPDHLVSLGDCITNYYQVVGDCNDLSDFLHGWTGYIKIHSYGEVVDATEGGGSFDGDEAIMDDLPHVAASVYVMGKLSFGQKGSVETYSEVKDVVWGSRVQCGSCGPSDDGTKLAYWVCDNTIASPGQAPAVYYTVDSFTNVTELAITGAASTDVPQAIDIVGNFLVVVFDDGSTGGYWYSEINRVTGIPSSTWTKVTTGFVAAKAPKDLWVKSPREIWFCGEGGYIYKSTSLTAGVSAKDKGDTTTNQLNRIHGADELIVAVGESGTVVYSENRGDSFTTTTNNPSANGLDALWVAHDYLWWAGDDSGDLYYSKDQGDTAWTEMVFDSAATAINDIVFASAECGFVSYTTSGPAGKISATFNGGVDWTNTAPRIQNLPTYDRGNRLAVPDVPNLSVAVNNILVGGLAGNGSDGIVLLGKAATI